MPLPLLPSVTMTMQATASVCRNKVSHRSSYLPICFGVAESFNLLLHKLDIHAPVVEAMPANIASRWLTS